MKVRGGVTKNYLTAKKWYQLAAELGCAQAQYNLGNCLKHGYGIRIDLSESTEWFEKAALNGNKKALLEFEDEPKKGLKHKYWTKRAFKVVAYILWYMICLAVAFYYMASQMALAYDIYRTTEKDGMTFVTYDGGYMLTEYTGNETDLVIPEKVRGIKVTGIAGQVFDGNTTIESITISDSVTTIKSYAFYNCTSLTSINVSSENITYKSIDGNLYSYDGTTLIQYAVGKTDTSFTIPDSVTTIEKSAFSRGASLVSVSIPDSVTTIGTGAFGYCSSLINVTIPDSVTTIDTGVFEYCYSLETITLPCSLTTIEDHVFYDCTSLTNITLPDSLTTIERYAFYDCSSLTNIILPDSLTTIERYAFAHCFSFKSVTLGNSLTTIGTDAFYDCTSLTNITIPDRVTNIEIDAFEGCTLLRSVTFENTEGWYISKSSTATSGTEVDVTDPNAAATYLTKTYYNYYWKR